MRRSEQYRGQRITLVGYFRGLDLLNEVTLDPPTNRLRDWVVKDDTGAIYVSYKELLPFSPASHEVWRIVRVTGEVAVHKNGMPYIIPEEVEWEGLLENYDVLPASCIVAIHRFDGTDQLDHQIYWFAAENLVVHDAKANYRGVVQLKRGEIYDLERAFDKAKFFKSPNTVGTECEGCMRYHIAAVNPKENEPHFVTLYEGSVPSSLEAFIDQIVEKTAETQPIQ
jgi:hypothetical protein